jgi:hypothetical protein
MDCPECAKNGKIVAMKKDRGSRPGRRPERGEAVFIEDDMWVCPTCEHVEVVKDRRETGRHPPAYRPVIPVGSRCQLDAAFEVQCDSQGRVTRGR